MDTPRLKELVEAYEPNERVLAELARIELLGTVGATASGKTTVMEEAIRSSSTPKLKMVLSDVSRALRGGEANGRDYFFRSKDEMIEGIKGGIYVQVAMSPGGDIYATRPASYPKNGVGTMAILSHVIKIFRSLPFEKMRTAFIVPKSFEQWQKWMAAQAHDSSWDESQLQARLEEARMSYEFALSDKWMRFVLNDKPAAGGRRLLQVARGESPDDEPKARRLAEAHLAKLKVRLKG